ncbi:hypothetical protein BDQ17DRAFT_712170 [Cyathus striatus]|nr:hypothetical protein BDQ17DRAFT_712170 [Cyathus striatus]
MCCNKCGLPSYGPGFSEIEGGVFVTEYADTAISIWFFPRSNIPSSVTSSATTIDTSTLGLPVGNWPAAGCPGGFSNFFLPQSIVFDIVLCGSLGNGTYSQTCSGNCFMDNVLGNGSNYANAYFEIGSVRVFSQNVTNSSSGASSSSGANPSPSSSVLPVDGGWFVTVGFAVSIAGLLLMSS